MNAPKNIPQLEPGERIFDLAFAGLHIIQPGGRTRFGADAVLLADFCRIGEGDRVADLGTGTGIIALLLAGRHPGCRIDAVELRPDAARRAARSVMMNGLDDRIRVHECDLRREPALLQAASYHHVVCNPPYYKMGEGKISPCPDVAAARHELYCTLGDVVRTASALMHGDGRFSAVYPASRHDEFLELLREHGLWAARIRPVVHLADHPVILYLTEAGRVPGRPLSMSPLVQYDAQGRFTDEMKRIYHMDEE